MTIRDILSRAAKTAAQSFVAFVVASGVLTVEGITDTSILGKVAVAGLAAVLSAGQNVLILGAAKYDRSAPE